MKTIISLLLVLSFVSAAHAVSLDDFYASIGFGASGFDDVAEADLVNDGVTLNGLAFDSTETAWGITAGFDALPWLSIELGYSDLGESGASLNIVGTPITPSVTLSPNLPVITSPPPFDITSLGGVAPTAFTPRGAALNVEQWHLGAKFRKSLTQKFEAHWYLGLARSQFDVRGAAPVFVPTGTTGFVGLQSFMFVEVPYAKPDAEVGVNWGAGFDWRAHPRLDLGVQWRRHHAGVVNVDSYLLTVSTRL
ncbi:MAG: outer membrane beta-barrel protein [Gammaproteobacteria bacterium]